MSGNSASGPVRPVVTELRLSAFKGHRGAVLPLGPVTLVAGASGSGKSGVLEAYGALARLAGGDPLAEVFPDPAAYVPRGVRPDEQGRRGFRIGCTVDGPVGPVRLDVAVQAEPELRVVGERMTGAGRTLLETALRDPRRSTVQGAWYTAGAVAVTRAPLPDDRLATPLLPLRVAGRTEGQRLALAAAEQVVIALRCAFACDPRPERMRGSAAADEGLLRGTCDNLAAVLRRTSRECVTRHAALVAAVRAGCPGAGPVADLVTEELPDGAVRALVAQGEAGALPVARLGDGELRYLALALVLLTGPGVLEMDAAPDVLPARQALTVLADGFDRCLDDRQARELLGLAARMGARGHVRLLGTVGRAVDASGATGADESAPVAVLRLRDPGDRDGRAGARDGDRAGHLMPLAEPDSPVRHSP
ncbi:ATP-binding protein [Streptomyces sp. B1866]|uniref:AAA family ATPase n=1 Tax=Streptomyces sp. B1866 TaxID=3075431 RepID=UPI0028908728|nr:ATP-binding protein [Streptomyces sp. B1866]MDT3400048.1 ATP-binding protein [Streptomyces sp. B1866]